ncbi:MAG: ATP-binding protein [Sandaracinus sp.]|nr:ATP-binding protein [Sandaracinus sp.]MCB9625041.1 ATP-binding protein [Sandaracinus sp.]
MHPSLRLGARRTLDGKTLVGPFDLASHHLLTHAVVVGMTGSGKTGLVTVMVEEALRAGIPSLVFDIKGDLPNLALAFPSFDPAAMRRWVEPAPNDDDGIADDPLVHAAVEARRKGLSQSGIGEQELSDYAARTHVRVITPGSDAGESVHLFSAIERRSSRWDDDLAGARATLSAAVSLVLRLIGRPGEPGRSREHALVSVLAELRLSRGDDYPLEALVADVLEPPIDAIGAMSMDEFMSSRTRRELAADLNALLASPQFRAWRTGPTLDVASWMAPAIDERGTERTPVTIISVAHLDDDERVLVLGVILEEVLTWVRSLQGSQRLRAMIVFDELYGFLPPHPANPPTKRPLVALMKQARAYGVGCVLATQNPMDLDYRALSNAGTWCLGRLQTDADRARVLEGLGEDKKKSKLGALVKVLGSRWFVVRDAKTSELSLLYPRWAMSYLRGPMTGAEIRAAREMSTLSR